MTDHPNWKALATVDFSWKRFIKESHDTGALSKCADIATYSSRHPRPTSSKYSLTGNEAKQIYDDVVQLGLGQNPNGQHQEKSWESTKTVNPRSSKPRHRPRPTRHVGENKDLTSYCLKIHGASGSPSSRPTPRSRTTSGLRYLRNDSSPSTQLQEKDSEVGLHNDLCLHSSSSEHKLKFEKGSTSDSFAYNLSNAKIEDNSAPTLPKYMPDVASLNSVMKEVQRNNVEFVRKHIEGGMDVNAVDGYGWTMLMVAVCAGAVGVVQLLLKFGADVYVKDKSGYSCQSLAKHHGHLHIINMLDNYKQSMKEANDDMKNTMPSYLLDEGHAGQTENFYCDTCNRSFCETTQEKHMSSTVHLFNSRPQSLGTIYGIPESNIGYQILLKRGWDKESGLGRDGTGQKFPCKTVLKRDRTGLGVQQPKPRVTHFEPKEEAAVRHVNSRITKQSNKRTLVKLMNQEKLKERKLRNELS